MSWVVVDVNTRLKVRNPRSGAEIYHTLTSAKRAATRLSKLLYAGDAMALEVMDYPTYVKQVPMTTVYNLMTQKPVSIRADQVGTCVDPSTETYWSS